MIDIILQGFENLVGMFLNNFDTYKVKKNLAG
jgi:hypothetical protein